MLLMRIRSPCTHSADVLAHAGGPPPLPHALHASYAQTAMQPDNHTQANAANHAAGTTNAGTALQLAALRGEITHGQP